MFSKRERGQAIVIVAAGLVVVLAFAALAIDMGAAYTAKREAQNASDAGAMAGARQVALECNSGAGADEANIRDTVLQMVEANAPGAAAQVYYIDANGNRVFDNEVGAVGYVPCGCDSNRAHGVEVIVDKASTSFLANVVSKDTLGAKAEARARFGQVSTVSSGLYPITRRNVPLNYGQVIEIRVTDNADAQLGNFGWLTWNGDTNVPNLGESLTPPGDSGTKYYNPGTPDNGFTPDYGDKQINIGDWVQGATGNMNANEVRTRLDWFISTKTPLVIPLYDSYTGQGANFNYRVASFAAFEMQSYNLTGQTKSITAKFLRWVTPGDWAPPVPCGSENGVYSIKLVP